jgi:uncharacterized protein YecE (DUF72 family)
VPIDDWNISDIRPALQDLARNGVFIGTSSWKYPGWLHALYQEARYMHRGRFSNARFERECLSEYATVFSSVGVDAAYYTFPSPKTWDLWTSQVPSHFRFSLKVTADITLKHFPNIPRFGKRAGQPNPSFLDATLFRDAFLQPLEPYQSYIGLLMFEFSHFSAQDYHRGRDFVADLDRFFSQLPQEWAYGVELRNRSFLHPEYFGMLARHGITHVFNSWEEMPSVNDQMELTGAFTTPDRVAARFLLRPGCRYAEAIKKFSPYTGIVEPVPEARMAGAELIANTLKLPGQRKAFLYVNNRLEGYALGTIAAMVALARQQLAMASPPEEAGLETQTADQNGNPMDTNTVPEGS